MVIKRTRLVPPPERRQVCMSTSIVVPTEWSLPAGPPVLITLHRDGAVRGASGGRGGSATSSVEPRHCRCHSPKKRNSLSIVDVHVPICGLLSHHGREDFRLDLNQKPAINPRNA
jgi:hypothetical protein